MKRSLLILVLGLFLISSFAFSFEPVASNFSIVPTASAQTTVRRRRHKRSFWQKHRDKLTLAMGTGAGAAIGGLLGGKKWAGIGALSGLGGSALYTYKLRHRSRRY